MTNLENLYLTSSVGFSSFPSSLAPLTKLKTLSIDADKAILTGVAYPASLLSGVSSLTSLSIISDYGAYSVVPDFSDCTSLESIVLRGAYSSLPDIFSSFTSLVSLDVSDNTPLTKLPASLSQCTNLTILRATDCSLNLADSFFDMSNTKLTRILLNRNEMRDMPTALCQLPTTLASGATMVLNLNDNPLRSIPSCFSENTKLTELYMSYTLMTSFPTPIMSLPGLLGLSWYNNEYQMTANVDFSALTKLTYLDFTNIRLAGSFPNSLSTITGLTTLCLRSNLLNGTISSNFFQQLTQLGYFDIEGNQVAGAFPSSIGATGTAITILKAHRNRFTSLPNSLQSLTNLTMIDFSNNRLTAIPSAAIWKGMAKLTDIEIGGNVQLNGPLPTFWTKSADFSSLVNVNMSYTGFSGNFPDIDSTRLAKVTISHASLNGSIAGFTRASGLKEIRISHNALSGSIPESIMNATKLFVLDASHNSLNGTLPANLMSLSQLGHLLLLDNQLTGSLSKAGKVLVTFLIQDNQFDLCAFDPVLLREFNPGFCNISNNAAPNACGCTEYYRSCTMTTCTPSNTPSRTPSRTPSLTPTNTPITVPTATPSSAPSVTPSAAPSGLSTPLEPTSGASTLKMVSVATILCFIAVIM